MSILGNLPEGVTAAMFLRDGYPQAIVCKVLMDNGCIGIGLVRQEAKHPRLSIEQLDDAALLDAIKNVNDSPPDYTELHEHSAKMKEATAARAAAEVDNDLQASLGNHARE